jgi:hypothetical protein
MFMVCQDFTTVQELWAYRDDLSVHGGDLPVCCKDLSASPYVGLRLHRAHPMYLRFDHSLHFDS